MKNSGTFVDRIRPLFEGRPRGQLLYLAAMLESAAASRYREWAAKAGREDLARGLRACADREDDVAATIREHFDAELEQPDDSSALMKGLLREVEELSNGRAIEEQYLLQAAAERAGELLWMSLAAAEPDTGTKAVFLRCAELEAASASYLEDL